MDKQAPYTGPWPRKRHSHTCQHCKQTRGQRAVYCYRQKCALPQSVEDCVLCRALARHTPPDDERGQVAAQLPPEVKTLDPDDDKGRTQTGNTPTCEDCGESLDHCECGNDDDPDCADCGEPLSSCECYIEDEPESAEPESGSLFAPAETKQSSLAQQFDRDEWERLKYRQRELAANPAQIKAALPGFFDLLGKFDACMKADDVEGAMRVHELADKYAADLQGGSSFGILTDEGAATLLEDAAAAPDGEVPMWGQRGNFVLRVGLTLIRFEVDGIYGVCDPFHFSIHAVNWDKPFPSGTGYRSFFTSMQHVPVGATVADWVADSVQRYIREECRKGLPMIAFENRDRHADDPANTLPVVNAAPQSAPFEPKVIVGLREKAKAPEPPPEPPADTLFGPAFRAAIRKPVVAVEPPSAQLSLFGGAL